MSTLSSNVNISNDKLSALMMSHAMFRRYAKVNKIKLVLKDGTVYYDPAEDNEDTLCNCIIL